MNKITFNTPKRVGRGIGSGKGGHTTGRGTKGQKSRTKQNILFEGVKTKKSLLHRIPLLRGKMKNKSFKVKPVTISTATLDIFNDGDTITIEALVKAGIVKSGVARRRGVKVVGKPTKKFNFEVPTSHTLRAQINA